MEKPQVPFIYNGVYINQRSGPVLFNAWFKNGKETDAIQTLKNTEWWNLKHNLTQDEWGPHRNAFLNLIDVYQNQLSRLISILNGGIENAKKDYYLLYLEDKQQLDEAFLFSYKGNGSVLKFELFIRCAQSMVRRIDAVVNIDEPRTALELLQLGFYQLICAKVPQANSLVFKCNMEQHLELQAAFCELLAPNAQRTSTPFRRKMQLNYQQKIRLFQITPQNRKFFNNRWIKHEKEIDAYRIVTTDEMLWNRSNPSARMITWRKLLADNTGLYDAAYRSIVNFLNKIPPEDEKGKHFFYISYKEDSYGALQMIILFTYDIAAIETPRVHIDYMIVLAQGLLQSLISAPSERTEREEMSPMLRDSVCMFLVQRPEIKEFIINALTNGSLTVIRKVWNDLRFDEPKIYKLPRLKCINYIGSSSQHMSFYVPLLRCTSCMKGLKYPVLVCGKCETSKYCGEECYENDWKSIHYKICSVASNPTHRICFP
jgi:hypothetical protein